MRIKNKICSTHRLWWVAAICLIAISLSGRAQEATYQPSEGVQFDQHLTWSELLAKAKQSNKILMVDFYTTWCAPCKHLDAHVFPEKEVGDFFNRHFISFKIQMDKTKGDDAYVQSRYGLADSLHQAYRITSYPTFLFFDGDGELLHRVIGAGDPIPEFLGRISEALDPSTQYYTKMRAFEKNAQTDPNLVRAYAELAKTKNDQERQNSLSARYFQLVESVPLERSHIEFAVGFNHASTTPAYNWLRKNERQIDALYGHGYAGSHILQVALTELYYGEDYFKYEEIEWPKFAKEAKRRYKSHHKQLVALAKATHYVGGKNNALFGKNVSTFMKKYGAYAHTEHLHVFAWEVFREVPLRKAFGKDALNWMDRVIAAQDDYVHRQTQACLLYVTGQREVGLALMEKVVNDVHEYRRAPFQKRLDLMRKGEDLR